MESRVKLLGHPVHPMLIVFPLGLFITAVVFDVIYLVTANPRWGDVSFWMVSAGLIGGAAAALFGWLDYLAVPRDTRARRVGFWHGFGNAIVLLLFLMSWFVRVISPQAPGPFAIGLGVVGVALAAVTGWLGGELVDRLGVGVDDGAHLDAPNSLSRRPVSERATRPQPR
jgi:uncharacterized membrane protein